jgi:hypothetical protein
MPKKSSPVIYFLDTCAQCAIIYLVREINTMTQISAVIIPNAEGFIKENLADFAVDGISAVYPHSKLTDQFGRTYFDEEEGKAKFVNFESHVTSLEKLVELISDKKLFVGGITNPVDLADPCNWDAEVVDAYFQILYHGEVIYG